MFSREPHSIVADDLLTKAYAMNALQHPTTRDTTALRTWINDHDVVTNDERYIDCEHDLLALKAGRETAAFDNGIKASCESFASWLLILVAADVGSHKIVDFVTSLVYKTRW